MSAEYFRNSVFESHGISGAFTTVAERSGAVCCARTSGRRHSPTPAAAIVETTPTNRNRFITHLPYASTHRPRHTAECRRSRRRRTLCAEIEEPLEPHPREFSVCGHPPGCQPTSHPKRQHSAHWDRIVRFTPSSTIHTSSP